MPRYEYPLNLVDHMDWIREHEEHVKSAFLVVVDPQYLKLMRHCARMTQTELAEAARVGSATIMRLESGEYARAQFGTVAAVTAALLKRLRVFGIDAEALVTCDPPAVHVSRPRSWRVELTGGPDSGRGLRGSETPPPG